MSLNGIQTISKSIFRAYSVSVKSSLTNAGSSLMHAENMLVLSLELPSRHEQCRFYLNLKTATIGQLVDEIKSEDAGIEQVHVYNNSGRLLAKSYLINSLMKASFTIQLNKHRTFLFDPIENLQLKENFNRQNEIDNETIKDTVAIFYRALNTRKMYHEKYAELENEADILTKQLEPLENVKNQLTEVCQRFISRSIWYGLAGLSFHVGVLAELTWFDYSWDIVEPMTYFIGCGTALLFYAYYLLIRSELEFMSLSDRLFLRKFYKEAQRHSFDIALYNQLKDRLFIVNTDLARLRAPLSLSLPVPSHSIKCKISGEELHLLNIYRMGRNSQR